MKVKVTLFKASGKYYTEEEWTVPTAVPRDDNSMRPLLGPYDMKYSPDFRRIDDGAVLVQSQEPWGYPHLFPSESRPEVPDKAHLAQRLTQVETRLQGIIEHHQLWDGS